MVLTGSEAMDIEWCYGRKTSGEWGGGGVGGKEEESGGCPEGRRGREQEEDGVSVVANRPSL